MKNNGADVVYVGGNGHKHWSQHMLQIFRHSSLYATGPQRFSHASAQSELNQTSKKLYFYKNYISLIESLPRGINDISTLSCQILI